MLACVLYFRYLIVNIRDGSEEENWLSGWDTLVFCRDINVSIMYLYSSLYILKVLSRIVGFLMFLLRRDLKI